MVLLIRVLIQAGRVCGLFKDDATPAQIQADLHALLDHPSYQPTGAPAPDKYRNPG